ncbi:MAG: hypothetical protein EBZ69_07135 [Alphaproteobacteria bacterium]|nr:hypothetical protein [Alphaproteobacteria bacterium]
MSTGRFMTYYYERSHERLEKFLALITTDTRMDDTIQAAPFTALLVAQDIILSLPRDQRLAAWQKIMATPAMQDAIKADPFMALFFAQDIILYLPSDQKLAMWQAMIANPAMQGVLGQYPVVAAELLGNILARLTRAQLREAGIVTREIKEGDVEHDIREQYSGSVYVVPRHLLPEALPTESQTIIRFDDMQMTADQWANHWGAYKKGTRTIVRGSMAAMLRATATALTKRATGKAVEEAMADRIITAPEDPTALRAAAKALRTAAEAIGSPSPSA